MSCKQIFPPEVQGYQESSFEFASMGDNNFSTTDKRGFSWTQGDNAHGTFVAPFHKKFAVKHTLRDKGLCYLTSTPHASPQVQSTYPGILVTMAHEWALLSILDPADISFYRAVCYEISTSCSKPLSVCRWLLTPQFPLGKPRHATV